MFKFVGFLLVTVIVFGFLVPQMFLSKTYAMDRATLIEAPVDAVHECVRDLHTWKDWTPWNQEADPTLEYTFMGEAGQVGHSMAWEGERLGKGKLTLTGVEPTRIVYTMVQGGKSGAVGALVLDPRDDGDSTAVRWELSGSMEGMPYERYFALMMDKMVGPDFEAGLSTLKAHLEKAK